MYKIPRKFFSEGYSQVTLSEHICPLAMRSIIVAESPDIKKDSKGNIFTTCKFCGKEISLDRDKLPAQVEFNLLSNSN